MIYSMKKPSTTRHDIAQIDAHLQGFQALFDEHWPHVYRAVSRLVGDPDEAEDLALEAFIRLYQRFPLPVDELNTGGWLHRVVINLGLHSIRSQTRRQHYELYAGKEAFTNSPETSPAILLDSQEESRLARLALSQMNKQRSQLLILRYSGKTYKEIANELSLSPTSIGPLLLRAEREFEQRYRALIKEE